MTLICLKYVYVFSGGKAGYKVCCDEWGCG